MAHIVVIGAGMSALAAAARLAARGHRVTVCERLPTYGGGVGGFERDGFRFDTGPALLHLPAVYRDLFIKTAKGGGRAKQSLEHRVDLRAVNPAARHLFSDGTSVTLPNASRGGAAKELTIAFGDRTGRRWGELMNRARQVWEATRRPLLEEPLAQDHAALGIDPYPTATHWWARRAGSPPLAVVARRELRHPGAVALIEEVALRHGIDPRVGPASATALAYMEQTFGTWYPPGGMRALADAVYQRCLERGVEFRFRCEVMALTSRGGRVSALELAGGERLEMDLVVSGVDVAVLTRLLDAGERGEAMCSTRAVPSTSDASGPVAEPATDARPAVPGPPGRFTVFVALRGSRPTDTPHRTVVHAQDRDAELAAVFDGGAPVDRPTVEVLRPDDPGQCPDGHEAVTLRVVVAPHARATTATTGTVDWTADGYADRYTEQVLRAAEAAVPGLRTRVSWWRSRTPADTEQHTRAPGGGVPGPSLAGSNGAHLKPANGSPIGGLYLIGGSAHPGGGLPHAGMSAAVTAELIGDA